MANSDREIVRGPSQHSASDRVEESSWRRKGNPAPSGQHLVKFACSRCGDITDGFAKTDRFEAVLCRTCFGKRRDLRPHDLNDLSGKEWAAYSKSIDTFPDTRSEKQRQHGAAFPRSLAKTHIEMFTKRGQTVLDPFVGVGTTLDAAQELGRKGIGIDVNQSFLDLAKKDLRGAKGFQLFRADARRLSDLLKPNSVDLVFTSPPYSNLLQTVKGNFAYKWKEHSKISSIQNPRPYSASNSDIGNLPYDEFLDGLTTTMVELTKVLKARAYAAWVVKDFRNLKKGVPLVNFHGDVIECGVTAGLQLWDIRIFDQTRHRPLVCLGYPSKNYYLNIGHSYVLIFRNG
jgi:DNA modification methylase